MAFLVFPRIATISLTMAILPQFGPWIIAGITAIVCASCAAFYTIDQQKTFISAVASICAPCMVLHDHTKFFYVVNYTGSALLTILSSVLPVLVYYKSDLELEPYHIRRPLIFGNFTNNQVSLFPIGKFMNSKLTTQVH